MVLYIWYVTMEKPFDKWSQPGWRIEQKYGNKVLIGNWVEQKLQVGIFYCHKREPLNICWMTALLKLQCCVIFVLVVFGFRLVNSSIND